MKMPSAPSIKQKQDEFTLRDEALLILEKRGAVLEIAREVSRLMREAGLSGAIIGGIAVVLHGHIRTTKDIDIFMPPPLEPLADLLKTHGFAFDRKERAFIKHGVPIHLVLPEQTGSVSQETVEIEGITTVTLADLINIKLRSGSTNLLRAQDLADVIGLIRHHQLTGSFAQHLDKSLRLTFRKLARMVRQEGARKPYSAPF
jgi:hypothetical protein